MDVGAGRDGGPDGHPLALRFEALRDRLAGTAFHVLDDRQDAREAVQEAFVRCWRGRAGADGVRALDAWIFSVVLNAAKDLRRRRTVRRAEPLPAEEAMQPTSLEPGPLALAERREDVARVRAAIGALPESEREVFLLRENGDLTFEAIASLLRVPVGTAKTRMRAALRRIREALAPRSGAPLLLERISSPPRVHS
ncbi:MAG TPA: RNA polymerase sigma factor [Planctomycetota bacterium]|jgi:RNA polymerase sigma-70 factor (ECF subfamily)|nr:RNA polymerase sigma factor [Planctomycetota bacterium]